MSTSHFSLPIIAAMDPGSPAWILDEKNWRVTPESAKAFQNARDGQGFGGIIFAEIDEKINKPIARVCMYPAFNKGDNLPKEDKWGRPYLPTEMVYSDIPFGTPGSGALHHTIVALEVMKKELEKNQSKLSKALHDSVCQQPGYEKKSDEEKKQIRDTELHALLKKGKILKGQAIAEEINETKGRTFGFGAIKGAESQNENDYEVGLTRPRDQSDNTPYKKYLVLVKYEQSTTQDDDAYHVYYFQNKKQVRLASKLNPLGTIYLNHEKIYTKKQIVDLSLESLRLNLPIKIDNKSISQNNLSISYGVDFESCIMYTDPERYNFENAHRVAAIHDTRDPVHSLRRHIPLVIMVPLCRTLLPAIRISDVEGVIKTHEDKWSSWTNLPFIFVDFEDFEKLSLKKKREIIEKNINLTFHFLYKKFKYMLYFTTKNLQKGQGLAYSNSYINILKDRLDQLILSHQRCSLTQESFFESKMFKNPFKEDFSEDDWVSKRECSMEHALQCDMMSYVEGRIKNPEKVSAEIKKSIITRAEALCIEKNKSDVINAFSARQESLLSLVKQLYGDEKTIKYEFKCLLQMTDAISGMTALENVIHHGWYDLVPLLVFHGADMNAVNKHSKKTVLDVLFDQAMTEHQSSNKDQIKMLDAALANIIHLTQSISQEIREKIIKCSFLSLSNKALGMKPMLNLSQTGLSFLDQFNPACHETSSQPSISKAHAPRSLSVPTTLEVKSSIPSLSSVTQSLMQGLSSHPRKLPAPLSSTPAPLSYWENLEQAWKLFEDDYPNTAKTTKIFELLKNEYTGILSDKQNKNLIINFNKKLKNNFWKLYKFAVMHVSKENESNQKTTTRAFLNTLIASLNDLEKKRQLPAFVGANKN